MLFDVTAASPLILGDVGARGAWTLPSANDIHNLCTSRHTADSTHEREKGRWALTRGKMKAKYFYWLAEAAMLIQ